MPCAFGCKYVTIFNRVKVLIKIGIFKEQLLLGSITTDQDDCRVVVVVVVW